MKAKNFISGVSLFLLLCLAATGTAYGQANSNKAVFHFGGAYSSSIHKDLGTGFFGIDLYTGKMFTNTLCLGFATGYDIIHNQNFDTGNETFKDMLGVIPFTIKAKYYFTFTQMVQAYVSAGSGVYRVLPSFQESESLATVRTAANCPGISIGLGLDYWFLLTTGIGFEVEYHMFRVPEGDDIGYWQARVNYSLIKF